MEGEAGLAEQRTRARGVLSLERGLEIALFVAMQASYFSTVLRYDSGFLTRCLLKSWRRLLIVRPRSFMRLHEI